MPARVFVHPRCLHGPAQGALEAMLIERGLDLHALCISPPTQKGHFEFVSVIERIGDRVTLERMDGTRYIHTIKLTSGEVA